MRALALLVLAACGSKSESPPTPTASGSAQGSAAQGSAAPASAPPVDTPTKPPAPPVPTVTVPAAAAGLDVAVAFAPTRDNIGLTEALVERRVSLKSVSAMIRAAHYDETAIVPYLQATVASDLDRDGKVDLIEIPQARFGGRVDWVIGIPENGKLRKLFTATGQWDGARIEKDAATLRFQATMKYEAEPRVMWTLYYTKGKWAPPIKSFTAMQGKIPQPRPPYHSFETRSGAKLRATPQVDDSSPQARRPEPDNDSKRPGWPYEPTQMLRGNVFVAFPPGARGLVLASEGAWRYVAFAPAIGPSETPVPQDVIPEDNGPRDAWHCGWVAAAEIDEEQRAR